MRDDFDLKLNPSRLQVELARTAGRYLRHGPQGVQDHAVSSGLYPLSAPSGFSAPFRGENHEHLLEGRIKLYVFFRCAVRVNSQNEQGYRTAVSGNVRNTLISMF